MNRKLQHTVQALTASVAVFGLLLLAGGAPTSRQHAPDILMAAADAGEPGLAETSDAGERPGTADRVHRNHRSVLAMPYFSFAKGGLRHVTGG